MMQAAYRGAVATQDYNYESVVEKTKGETIMTNKEVKSKIAKALEEGNGLVFDGNQFYEDAK